MNSPYSVSSVNNLYNLLFCDDLSLYVNERSLKAEDPWKTLLANSPDQKRLNEIAGDESQESRVRALAYSRLREAGYPVPSKKLYGVIVEVPLAEGLDVLAAYRDGSVRYLNHSGKVLIFEPTPVEVSSAAIELVSSSQTLVDNIGPWKGKRLAPPKEGNVRMSFLVSDGLYVGEAPYPVLRQDPMGGPILARAERLLQLIVETATNK